MQQEEVSDVVKARGFYSLEVDEGPVNRSKWLITIATCRGAVGSISERFFAGAPRLPSTKAEVQLTAILGVMAKFTWAIMFWLWMVSDCASSMLLLAELASQKKAEVMAELEIAGNLVRPAWLPEDIRNKFYVLSANPESYDLIPVDVNHMGDIQHKFKNAEKAAFNVGLGPGLKAGTGEMKAGSHVVSELLSFARLFALSHQLRDIISEYEDDAVAEKFSTLPGDVKHRLMILTLIAVIINSHSHIIEQATGDFILAFGKDQQKKATVDHVAEIHCAMRDPRILVACLFIAPLHEMSTAVYAIFQESGGFLLHRSRGDLLEMIDLLHMLDEDFDVLYAQQIADARRSLVVAQVRAMLLEIAAEHGLDEQAIRVARRQALDAMVRELGDAAFVQDLVDTFLLAAQRREEESRLLQQQPASSVAAAPQYGQEEERAPQDQQEEPTLAAPLDQQEEPAPAAPLEQQEEQASAAPLEQQD